MKEEKLKYGGTKTMCIRKLVVFLTHCSPRDEDKFCCTECDLVDLNTGCRSLCSFCVIFSVYFGQALRQWFEMINKENQVYTCMESCRKLTVLVLIYIVLGKSWYP